MCVCVYAYACMCVCSWVTVLHLSRVSYTIKTHFIYIIL